MNPDQNNASQKPDEPKPAHSLTSPQPDPSAPLPEFMRETPKTPVNDPTPNLQLPDYGGDPYKSRRKYLLITALFLVVICVGVSWALSVLNPKVKKTTSSSHTTSSQSSVINRPSGTLDLSPLIDTNATIKSQTLKGKLNQQLNMNDGFSFMVTKVDSNFVSPNQYAKPDAGKQFIAVYVVGGNRQKDKTMYFAPDTIFKLKNSKGGLETSYYGAAQPNFESSAGSLQPGGQKTAIIVFSVDPDEKPLTLVYRAKYDKIAYNDGQSHQQDKATLTGEVPLQ